MFARHTPRGPAPRGYRYIYALYSTRTGALVYIGQTARRLSARLAEHRKAYGWRTGAVMLRLLRLVRACNARRVERALIRRHALAGDDLFNTRLNPCARPRYRPGAMDAQLAALRRRLARDRQP